MQKSQRTFTCALQALAFVLVAAFSSSAMSATPAARQVFAPLWQSKIFETSHCLFTIFLPAQEDKGCVSFTRRETAGPAFHRQIGVVLVGGSDSKLHSFSAKDGALLWERELPGALVSQPVFDKAAAFFGTDEGHVLRVDVTSGETRWEVEVDAEVTEPLVVDDDIVIAVTGLDTVYAFSRHDGAALWVHKHPLPPGITLRGQARPFIHTLREGTTSKRYVYAGHASGRLSVIDAQTGRVVNELAIAGDEPSFTDVDADALIQSGRLIAASQSSGIKSFKVGSLEPDWTLDEKGIVRLQKGGRFLVFAAGAKKVIALDARSGQSIWRFTFEKGAPTRMVSHEGRVMVASDLGALYVLDALTGRPLQYFGSGLGFASDLSISGDMMFAVSTAGRLFALSNAFSGIVQ